MAKKKEQAPYVDPEQFYRSASRYQRMFNQFDKNIQTLTPGELGQIMYDVSVMAARCGMDEVPGAAMTQIFQVLTQYFSTLGHRQHAINKGEWPPKIAKESDVFTKEEGV